jgi:hypothetical protein
VPSSRSCRRVRGRVSGHRACGSKIGAHDDGSTVGAVIRSGAPPDQFPKLSSTAHPERKRTTTWSAFIRIHLALLAGTDFFTAGVLTLRGLVTYHSLEAISTTCRSSLIAAVSALQSHR